MEAKIYDKEIPKRIARENSASAANCKSSGGRPVRTCSACVHVFRYVRDINKSALLCAYIKCLLSCEPHIRGY